MMVITLSVITPTASMLAQSVRFPGLAAAAAPRRTMLKALMNAKIAVNVLGPGEVNPGCTEGDSWNGGIKARLLMGAKATG